MNMKRFIFGLAFLATMFAGCQTEPMNEPSITGSAAFEALTEVFVPQTKTSMTSDKHVVWSAGDQAAIFQGSTLADRYEATESSAGQGNAIFEIIADNSTVNGNFSAGTELPCNVAVYPYADGLSLAGEVLQEGTTYVITGFSLPDTQTYKTGSFGDGSFPMVAVTKGLADHNLNFKNVLGAMKLQLKGTQTVKSIKVEGKNNENLSGSVTITAYADNAAPAVTMTGADDASKAVTLDCGDGVQLSESTATEFIIALPPVLFSQGFTVTVTDSEDETYTVETDKANTVLRSSILTMPAVTLAASGEGTPDEDNTESGVKVLDISFDKSSLTLAPNTSYSIATVVVPSTADDKTLTWSSTAPTIATVDQAGVVTAISDGEAIITAVAVGGASKSCTVTVISLPEQATATADYIDEYKINHGKGIAVGGTVWAPVNCGYKAPTVVDGQTTDKGYPYGKLYQWGRKYGQGYSVYYDSEPQTFNAPVSALVGQDASMADYFFVGSSDWVETHDGAMWNSGTENAPVKTINDPCPTGWRIPTYNELNALRTIKSAWITNDAGQRGCYFSGATTTVYDTTPETENPNQVFFPVAGTRRYSDGSAIYRGDYGYYWSSRPGSSGAYGLYFYSSYASMSYYDRANGYSVRCVQE